MNIIEADYCDYEISNGNMMIAASVDIYVDIAFLSNSIVLIVPPIHQEHCFGHETHARNPERLTCHST